MAPTSELRSLGAPRCGHLGASRLFALLMLALVAANAHCAPHHHPTSPTTTSTAPEPHFRPHQRRHLAPPSSRQQQPASIVVISSDNSYVSASPLQIQADQSTEQPPQQRRPHRHLEDAHRTPKKLNRHRDEEEIESSSSSDISTTATTATTTRRSAKARRAVQRQRTSRGIHEWLEKLWRSHEEEEEEDEAADDDNDDDNEEVDVEEEDEEVEDDEEEEDERDEEEEEEDDVGDGEEEELEEDFDDLNEIGGDTLQVPASSRIKNLSKRGHGVGAHFSAKPATIIKTRESLQMGANFINYTLVTNLQACLVECWITDSCDTAVYQETPVDFNNHLPPATTSAEKPQQHPRNHNYLSSSLALLAPAPSPSIASSISGANSRSNIISSSSIRSSSNSLLLDKFTSQPLDVVGDQDDDLSQQEEPARLRQRARQPEQQQQPGFFVCYLFQCAKPDGFKCQFSAHNYYVSSLRLNRAPKTTTATSPTQVEPADERVRFNEIRPNQHEVRYARIVGHQHQRPQVATGGWLARPQAGWRDVRHISIEQEDYNHYAATMGGGLNSAFIAIMMGIGATGMLVFVVANKMKSIRRRIAYRSGRAKRPSPPQLALVPPDGQYLITTAPM